MKTQHTPGPLTFHPEKLEPEGISFWQVPIHAGNAVVAFGRGPSRELALANAEEIVSRFNAAPALYRALEGLLRTWEHLSSEQIVARFSAQVSGPIIAALASATPQGEGQGE